MPGLGESVPVLHEPTNTVHLIYESQLHYYKRSTVFFTHCRLTLKHDECSSTIREEHTVCPRCKPRKDFAP